jgi:cell fate (sporulation/competence/biofilm development) regulator YmcA (YheA/YmcA/DUF963 family)
MRFYISILFFLFCSSLVGLAQNTQVIKGIVSNGFTKDPIPYASVRWAIQKTGVLTDSAGKFTIQKSSNPKDSLLVDYVGFETHKYALTELKKEFLNLTLDKLFFKEEATVKTKFNKGLRWWKLIVTNKPQNNPYQIAKYNCELYNKLELDLNNVNKNSFSKISFLKPFSFILDNIDSVSDEKPFLPILMSETLSDFYYSNNPQDTREVIKATQIYGIKNDNLMELVGNVNQKINIYDNYMKLLGKEFISPISDFADKFYKFKGADTQYVKGIKVFHLLFSPLRDGENTFSGEAWVDAQSWAIHKINLNISSTADINFVNRLSVTQEFERLASGKLIFSKDKITTDFSPLPNDKLTLIVRKTISYKNFDFAEEKVNRALQLNKKKNELVSTEKETRNTNFWNNTRHESLNKNEQNVFRMIDTLKSIPLFKEYTRNAEFLIDGHRKLGKIEIGPWYKWISGNELEKVRLRFDLGTTELFSKQLRLSGYLAYGTKDKQFKEKFLVQYKFPKLKGLSTEVSYLKDLDNGRVRFNEEDLTIDNIFSQLLRRPGIPQKFLGEEEYKASILKEWENGLSNSLTLTKVEYEPYTPLPSKSSLNNGNYLQILNTDFQYRIRYAPGEKKIVTNRRPIRFKGSKPIYELRINEGAKGILGGHYSYTKIHAAISQRVRIPNFGIFTYNAYAGKIFGDSLPFMLLELHPGNEVYMYNKNGFNLMNRFEYYSDSYAGFQMEHNIEKKLINLIPFLRKTSIRQFWTLKGVVGSMTASNRAFNRTELGPYQLRSLKDHFYLEYGTGFDNILRFFRIDFVWRQAPPYPANYSPSRMQPIQNFGVFGSLRIQL